MTSPQCHLCACACVFIKKLPHSSFLCSRRPCLFARGGALSSTTTLQRLLPACLTIIFRSLIAGAMGKPCAPLNSLIFVHARFPCVSVLINQLIG